MRKTLYFLLFFSFALGLSGQKYPQNHFASPLRIPLILSGTFGELRSNHFHSGLDIKTAGVEGQQVLASADGDVVRIKVSPYGYGKALYIRHPNGYTTVYAHLQKFSDPIQAWVKEQQYRNRNFEVDLYPPTGKFSVKQGEVIALSGNSGGSGGPHLHFEIRDSRTEEPLNPLLFGFDIADNRPPEPFYLGVVPMDEFSYSHLSGGAKVVSTGPGKFVAQPRDISVYGNLGVVVGAFDRQDGAWNKNGIFALELFRDSVQVYRWQAERFSFDETRYINAHMHYERVACCNSKTHSAFRLPGNQLRMYSKLENNGVINLKTGEVAGMKALIWDFAGNRTEIAFNLVGTAPKTSSPQGKDGLRVKHNEQTTLKWPGMQISIPAGTLYQDTHIDFEPQGMSRFDYAFTLGHAAIPAHKRYSLSLNLSDTLIFSDESKWCLVEVKNGRQYYLGGELKNGVLTATPREFGDFALVKDDVPPKIEPINITPGKNLQGWKTLRVKIYDNLSGIKSYTPSINGEWILMDYDAKNNLLIFNFEDGDPGPGTHEFAIEVVDNRGNRARYSATFSR